MAESINSEQSMQRWPSEIYKSGGGCVSGCENIECDKNRCATRVSPFHLGPMRESAVCGITSFCNFLSAAQAKRVSVYSCALRQMQRALFDLLYAQHFPPAYCLSIPQNSQGSLQEKLAANPEQEHNMKTAPEQ